MDGLESLLVLLWIGGGAALVAVALTYAFGRNGSRILLLLASGGAVLLAWYVFFRVSGYYEEDSSSCTDCGWGEVIAFVTLLGNAIGWAIGVAVGAGARYVADRRRQPRTAVS